MTNMNNNYTAISLYNIRYGCFNRMSYVTVGKAHYTDLAVANNLVFDDVTGMAKMPILTQQDFDRICNTYMFSSCNITIGDLTFHNEHPKQSYAYRWLKGEDKNNLYATKNSWYLRNGLDLMRGTSQDLFQLSQKRANNVIYYNNSLYSVSQKHLIRQFIAEMIHKAGVRYHAVEYMFEAANEYYYALGLNQIKSENNMFVSDIPGAHHSYTPEERAFYARAFGLSVQEYYRKDALKSLTYGQVPYYTTLMANPGFRYTEPQRTSSGTDDQGNPEYSNQFTDYRQARFTNKVTKIDTDADKLLDAEISYFLDMPADVAAEFLSDRFIFLDDVLTELDLNNPICSFIYRQLMETRAEKFFTKADVMQAMEAWVQNNSADYKADPAEDMYYDTIGYNPDEDEMTDC